MAMTTTMNKDGEFTTWTTPDNSQARGRAQDYKKRTSAMTKVGADDGK